MELIDAKTIDVNGRKVSIEMYGPHWFNGNYKVLLKLAGDFSTGEVEKDAIKGCYTLARLAFDNFGDKQAKNFVERKDKLRIRTS